MERELYIVQGEWIVKRRNCAATFNNRDGRALGKCPVDIYSEGARWRAGKMIKRLYFYSVTVF